MTTVELWTYFIVQLLLCVWIAVSFWFCFRRTGIKTFILLGAFLVILWPAFDALTAALLERSVAQVMEGQTPSMFPFSLMVRGDTGWTGWQMPASEFITKFHFAKLILRYLVLAILIALLARSLKDLKQPEAKQQ